MSEKNKMVDLLILISNKSIIVKNIPKIRAETIHITLKLLITSVSYWYRNALFLSSMKKAVCLNRNFDDSESISWNSRYSDKVVIKLFYKVISYIADLCE